MDYEDRFPAAAFGHALSRDFVNLLVRDVRAEAGFFQAVFGMQAHRLSADFAIMLHAGQPFQLHSDGTFAAHPLFALLPESGPRGAGIELRLHEADPDLAAARLADFPDAMLLQTAHRQDRCRPARGGDPVPAIGYAWVPSRTDQSQPLNCGRPSVSS